MNHTGRTIEIRLLRNPELEDAHTDDKINIFPSTVDEEKYEVVFRDADSRVKYTLLLDEEDLYTYMEGLYVMLPKDKDPYRGIQFSIPGFPCVLFSIQDLKDEPVQAAINNLIPLLVEIESSVY